MAGFWTHRDVVENAFDFEDLLDAHEILQVRAENEARAREASENSGQFG